MKDKSKRLTVVNTGKKPSEKKEVQQTVVQPSSSSSSHAPGFNPALYLLKSVWDSVFEIKTDVSGQKYLFGKLPMVTQYGVTMYGDNDELNVSDIYEGLPIDNITLYWDKGVLKAKGGEEGGGEADSIAWANVYGKPSWITDTKPKYSYSEIGGTPDLSVYVTGSALNKTLADYATLTYLTGELKKYVTLDGAQDIKGVKNFVNGLKIANMPITKLQDDVIYIDANLVVRGGVTMYSTNEADIPTIKDEIGFAGYNGSVGLASFDSSQFVISANGTVSVKGGSAGLDTTQLKEYLDNNKYTTETWVKAQGYASASSLSSLQTKVNNFLEGSDTDTIINKWKELEAFLSGLSESDNLATILSTKWTTDNNLISQWNTAYGWGDHSKVGYALKSYVDNNFVTLGTKQTITGEKNFTGGLRVNNSPSIYYDATNKYWKLEGDLLVTGGVTMYGTDEGDIPSILDSLPIASTSSAGIASFDSTYFSVNASGKVTLTSSPSMVSILGSLQDVSSSVSGTTNSDVVLFKSANTSTWTTKPLSEIGGGSIQRPLRWTGYGSGTWDGTSDGLIVIPTSLKNPNALTFTGAVSATYDGSSAVTVNIPTAGGNIDLSNYLPLSGGTISGDLTMNNSYGGLRFINTSNNNLGFLGYSGGSAWYLSDNYWNTSFSILHTGNYSSYALPKDGNAVSATKLQTAVTLWGKTFDGTQSLVGSLKLNNNDLEEVNAIIFADSVNASNEGIFFVRSNANYDRVFAHDGEFYIYPNQTLTSSSTGHKFLTSGNYHNYALPLSGGTLYTTLEGNDTSLVLRSRNINSWLAFRDKDDTFLGSVGVKSDKELYLYTGVTNKIWHSGNDGSGSGLDADMLDGTHKDSFFYAKATSITSSTISTTLKNGVYYTGGYSPVTGAYSYGTLLCFRSGAVGTNSRQTQIYISDGQNSAGGKIYYRDAWNSTSNITSTWYQLARINDNVASATKLQTARTIWGQSFDGTGNVNGVFSSSSSVSDGILMKLNRTSGGSVVMLDLLVEANRKGSLGYNGESVFLMNRVSGKTITIRDDNNIVFDCSSVGVGTSSPVHKFHVVGTTYMNGSAVISGSLLPTTPVELGNGSYPWSSVFSKQIYVLGEEYNEIFTQYYANGDLGSDLISIRNRLNFRWYDTYWGIGTIRGNNKYSIGFGFVYNNSLKLRITTEGNLLVTGGITMYSDIRKKTKLQDVELSLSQIANAPLIQHYYNSDQEKTTHVGSIAQYWAGLNDWFCKKDAEGFYTMEIQNCALASAISIARHLEKYESKTDKKIRMLKKRVQELEDKLERLEGGKYGC